MWYITYLIHLSDVLGLFTIDLHTMNRDRPASVQSCLLQHNLRENYCAHVICQVSASLQVSQSLFDFNSVPLNVLALIDF